MRCPLFCFLLTLFDNKLAHSFLDDTTQGPDRPDPSLFLHTMPRLTQDPNLAEKPDFASAAYDAVCQALAAAEQITREAVAARLADAWDADNNAKIAAWEQQVKIGRAHV